MGEEHKAASSRGDSFVWWVSLVFIALATVGMCLNIFMPRTAHPPHINHHNVDMIHLTMGLAAYRRDFGMYPPDDITAVGGSVDNGISETLFQYLGRPLDKGGQIYGPYVTFKKGQLTDADSDGFPEYRDKRGALYLYARDKEWRSLFCLVNRGFDGKLGGRVVPGKGYVPATTPEGKVAEADNIIFRQP